MEKEYAILKVYFYKFLKTNFVKSKKEGYNS